MQKHEWIQHIDAALQQGRPFTTRCDAEDKATLLFACDVFRRRRHDVRVGFDPTQNGKMMVHVCVLPLKTRVEFTLRREQTAKEIIDSITPDVNTISLRGCGTVINTVCKIMEWALNHGWFLQKSFLNTLTMTNDGASKQRNTTLVVVLRRGSNIDSI